MDKLTTYILTKNSQKYLAQILKQVHPISDEVLIIDSGSTDQTKEISLQFKKVKFKHNKFINFRQQRLFAEKTAKNDFIFFLDCDEIPNNKLIDCIGKQKSIGFDKDAYGICRTWYALGQKVQALYPVVSPDYPIRIYNKQYASFNNSPLVHERPTGWRTKGTLEGEIKHLTFENEEELNHKLQFYTDIGAKELIKRQKSINTLKILVNPFAAFIKFYILNKGFLNGAIGLKLGQYAYDYTKLKYIKAKKLKNE